MKKALMSLIILTLLLILGGYHNISGTYSLRGQDYEVISESLIFNDKNNFITGIGPREIELTGRTAVRKEQQDLRNRASENEYRVSLLEKTSIHYVQSGESLWEIANKYGIDIDTLIGANDISNMNRIQVGDELRILPVKGIIYKINPGENLWTISNKFNVRVSSIIEGNAISNPDFVEPGTTLLLPGAKPEFGYQERMSKKFMPPVEARISSYYGMRWGSMHEGIDYAVIMGTPVRAARSGRVIYSGWASGYGHTVVIEHQKGVRTLYAHSSELLVRSGQWVEKGEIITKSGNSGRSTGPHLHFEIQINGRAVNPLNYLP